MKRIVIFALMFAILAGAAFAQLTLGGEAYVGVHLEKDPDAEEATIGLHNRDVEGVRFNFTAIAERENYGIKLDSIFRTDDMYVKGLYGWVKFLDSSLRLSVGKISDPLWVLSLDNSLHEVSYDNVTGFRVDYKTPLPGLSVGIAFRTGNFIDDAFTLEDFGGGIVFGASYVNPLFNVVAAYDLIGDDQALLGFNFTGIDDLTAGIRMDIHNLASFTSDDNPGWINLYEKVGYRVMRPLEVYLLLGQFFSGVKDSDVGLQFTPGVSYRFTPRLTGLFSLTVYTPDAFDTTDLELKPTIEYTLGGPALLYVEYKLRFENMEKVRHNFGFGLDIKAF